MNVAFAIFLLAWLLIGCVLLYVDIEAECRHQAELDRLWMDEDDLAESA